MKKRRDKVFDTPISAASTNHLALLVAPLLRAHGISLRQFEKALRYAVVQSEASRFSPGKANRAQIAFSTGLNRADVAMLLRLPRPRIQSRVQCLTDLWSGDARFLSKDGRPADLPVFGRTRSFEKLAQMCGKALPVRAILDELLERRTVLLMPGQIVRLQQPVSERESAAWAKMADRLESAINEVMAKDEPRALGRTQIAGPRRTHLKRTSAAVRPTTRG